MEDVEGRSCSRSPARTAPHQATFVRLPVLLRRDPHNRKEVLREHKEDENPDHTLAAGHEPRKDDPQLLALFDHGQDSQETDHAEDGGRNLSHTQDLRENQ